MAHRIVARGTSFVDEAGRERIFHGINLVEKGHDDGSGTRTYRGVWTPADLDDLADAGFDLARLGFVWAAVEPEPGRYDESYLAWLEEQVDLLAARGFHVILDAHQDLYSDAFGDGAPAWATLTEQPFEPTELWSDAYLTSPAVHEAWDAFWANRPGPGGVGIQDRFVAMWRTVGARLGGREAVLGFDVLNEPVPGSGAPEIFGYLLGTFGELTGLGDATQMAAAFADPARKLAALDHLTDADLYRALGDAAAPIAAPFETDVLDPFYARLAAALSEAAPGVVVLRGNGYFSNMGVPCAANVAPGAYAPHGYDLVVDTDAVPLASDERVAVIFERHRETQERLGVPVIVGEWGAFGRHEGVRAHGRFLLDLFASYGWSHAYWCWEPGLFETEAGALLRRR
ncbi:glycoside hydrolase family 5 protein [Beutenbergia cavernae]|nr:cellulase family glycosylhydrolase [Beutenbergia cavernae]